MATRYSIFPSISDDRVYFAEDFLARPSRDFLAGTGDGVSREVGSALEVVETTPPSLAVDVSLGAARINGWRFEVHTGAEEVALDAADPTNPRIDRIILRARTGSSNRDAILTKLTGTPAGSPSAPALTRSGDTYEISLAQVAVAASATSVSDSDITDERGDNTVCGYLRAQDAARVGGLEENDIHPAGQISGINAQGGTTYNTQASDRGKLLDFNNASPVTCTIDKNEFAVNDVFYIRQKGAGQVTVAAGSGVTLQYPSTTFTNNTLEQYAILTVICVDDTTDANVFALGGMLASA